MNEGSEHEAVMHPPDDWMKVLQAQAPTPGKLVAISSTNTLRLLAFE
jgi:hypothetical protein